MSFVVFSTLSSRPLLCYLQHRRVESRQGLMNSNGQVKIWNYETQTDLKTFEVTDVPVRCVRYIARKNWVRASLPLCPLFPLIVTPYRLPPHKSTSRASRFTEGILTISSSPVPTTSNYEYTISLQERRSPPSKLIQIIFDV